MLLILARVILKISYLFPLGDEARAYVKTFLESVFIDQYQIRKYVKKGHVVADVGSFWGVFAWYASLRGAVVYAFEPSSENFKKASTLLQKRERESYLYQKAVGERRKTVTLRLHEVPAANTLADSGRDIAAVGSEMVEVVPLDEILETIHFLKIDAEGYERNVLEGARGLIQKCKPVVAMSAYHKEDDKKVLPEFLKSIEPTYECRLNKKMEEVLVCVPAAYGKKQDSV